MQQAPKITKDDYFKALTGYRAMAAYMVFWFHINPFATGTSLHSFFAGLRIGVPLFFVLSGFLIYNRYNTSQISTSFYKKYMINRIARIYPVYFLMTTATLLFNYRAAAFSPHWLKIYFLNITFLRGFFEKYVNSLIAQGWSLTVEEVFYILAPILFLLGMTSIRKYVGLFFAVFAFGWLLSFLSVDVFHGYFWADHKFMIFKTFFGNALTFFVGIIVAILHGRIREFKFKYVTMIGFAGLIGSLLLMAYFNAAAVQGDENGFTWKELIVYNFVSVPFVGAIVWGLVRERTWISRLFATETFQVLGKSSYSFYLIHIGIIHALIGKFISENVFLLFILLIFAAMALWRFIEEPMNELIRSRAKKIWVT